MNQKHTTVCKISVEYHLLNSTRLKASNPRSSQNQKNEAKIYHEILSTFVSFFTYFSK